MNGTHHENSSCSKDGHLAIQILSGVELFLLPLIILVAIIVLMTLLINHYLQTAPNVLFCNLVFADLVSAVLRFPYYLNFDILDVCKEKGDNELLCVVDKITTDMLDFELTILVCMSLERYIAINYAVWHIKHVTLRTIIKLSGLILFCHLSFKFGATLLASGNSERSLGNLTLCIEDNHLPTSYVYIHNILTAAQIIVCLILAVQITRKTKRQTFSALDNVPGKALYIEQVYEFTEVEDVEKVDCMQVTNFLLCIVLVLDEYLIHAEFLEGEIGYGYKKVVTFLDTLCSTVGVLIIILIKPLYRKCVIEVMTTPPWQWRTLRRSLEVHYLKDAIKSLRRTKQFGTVAFSFNIRELDDLERMMDTERSKFKLDRKDSPDSQQCSSAQSTKYSGSDKSGESRTSRKSGKYVIPRLFGPGLPFRTFKLNSKKVMGIMQTGTPV